MELKQAIGEIKRRWRELYPADKDKHNPGIICPLCNNGAGSTGDGAKMKKGTTTLHCFKCGFSGSVIDLYMNEHGMDAGNQADFIQAVGELADRLHIQLDPAGPARPGSGSPSLTGGHHASGDPRHAETVQETQEPIFDEPPIDYTGYLLTCADRLENPPESDTEQAGLAYLARRGISLATAKGYGIGYDPSWRSPTVCKRMEAEGKTWRPDPTPRLIIPTSPTHYVARDVRPADTVGEDGKRYAKMNEGRPDIFGWKQARKAQALYTFVVEGAMDALSLAEVGYTAIAINSTSNVDLLLEKLEADPIRTTFVLCLDNDDAGKKATTTLKAGLKKRGRPAIVANVAGEYKDANEALCADRVLFADRVAQAVNQAMRPDNTVDYVRNQLADDIRRFRDDNNKKTGFDNLDSKIYSLHAGLYIMGAISSLGKTTFALSLANNLAQQGHDVLYFSLEQSPAELVCKSLACLCAKRNPKTEVTAMSIRCGRITTEVQEAITEYEAITGGRLSIIQGDFQLSVGDIRKYVSGYIQRTGKTPIVFVDYLQILTPSSSANKSSKRDEIELTVTELKKMTSTESLGLTVFAISNVNRANYLQPFDFESLKESGLLEFSADCIWGLELACLDDPVFDKANAIKEKREKVKQGKLENPRKVRLVCLKNRYGVSSFECYFKYWPQHDLFMPDVDKEKEIANHQEREQAIMQNMARRARKA